MADARSLDQASEPRPDERGAAPGDAGVPSPLGVISQMTAQDSEMKAAAAAARAREVLAQRITKLVPGLDNDELAQVVLRLAEAYAHLAVEPPRSRAG